MAETSKGVHWALRIASAVLLLAAGGIHIYLVITGVGGLLGVMFILNGIAGIVLAAAVLLVRGRLLQLTAVLGLLFMIASVAALLLSLTIGLFGISTPWDYPLVRETLILESIGIVVLGIFTAVVLRRAPAVESTR